MPAECGGTAALDGRQHFETAAPASFKRRSGQRLDDRISPAQIVVVLSEMIQRIHSPFGPVIVHLLFLKLTEGASGSHPYRIVSVSYGRVTYFHGDNTVEENLAESAKRSPRLSKVATV